MLSFAIWVVIWASMALAGWVIGVFILYPLVDSLKSQPPRKVTLPTTNVESSRIPIHARPDIQIVADAILRSLSITLPDPREGLIAIHLVKRSIEDALGIDESSIEIEHIPSTTPQQMN